MAQGRGIRAPPGTCSSWAGQANLSLAWELACKDSFSLDMSQIIFLSEIYQ